MVYSIPPVCDPVITDGKNLANMQARNASQYPAPPFTTVFADKCCNLNSNRGQWYIEVRQLPSDEFVSLSFPRWKPPNPLKRSFCFFSSRLKLKYTQKNSQVKKVCATRIRKQTKEWRVWCQLAVLCENTSCYLCLPWHFLTLQFEHRAGERKKLHICTALA